MIFPNAWGYEWIAWPNCIALVQGMTADKFQ